MGVRGEAVVGSYGGGRQWCRVVERGSSPRLIVACVRLLSPMPTHCFPCLLVVSHVCTLLPVSTHCILCVHIVAFVHVLLPMSMHCCLCLHVVAHIPSHFVSHFRLQAVIFVYGHGWYPSFLGGCLHSGVVCSCSWVVCLHSWATA